MSLPHAEQRTLETPWGRAVGSSYQWAGGQYCAIHTHRGVVGCGVFDIDCANTFDMAFAIARGTPEHPLRTPEDLLTARIASVSTAAESLGIAPGMTGEQALQRMLADEATAGGDG